MKRYKYFTKNDNNKWEEVSEDLANDVIRQYVERRYTSALIGAAFLIGFLLGIVASA